MPSECKRACDCCNIRKIRCDGGNPCSRCLAAGIACTSLRERKKSGPRSLRQSKTKILKHQTAAFASVSAVSAVSVTSPLSDCASAAGAGAGAFAFDDYQQLFTGTMLPAPAWDLHRIALPVLRAVLLLYKDKLYDIWPLLQAEELVFRLETEAGDAELYALATALCGATLSYLDRSIVHELLPEPLTADAFVAESRRVRATFNYMEPVGLNTILTSYFLHMHYGRQPSRTQMAAFYIREAITFAHLLGLHNESAYMYPPWTPREQAVMRRLYFLLFMTERYLCIQQGLPTLLESISLPEVLDGGGDEQHPDVVGGFLHLVTLFSTPGRNFFGMWTSRTGDVSISREQLLLIQRALQRPLFDIGAIQRQQQQQQQQNSRYRHRHDDGPLMGGVGVVDATVPPSPPPSSRPTDKNNPIQLVDIVVSQHWIRSLAWKLSILLGYVSPNITTTTTSSSSSSSSSSCSPLSSANALSVAYPLEIAADTLRGIQSFPAQAFEVHGPGMEVKMCEIATALADSILCCSPPLDAGKASPSPSSFSSSSSSYYGKGHHAGARAVLKSLTDRIFETQTMNPGLRDALAGKVAVVLRCSDIAPNMPMPADYQHQHQHHQHNRDREGEGTEQKCDDDPVQYMYS